MSRPFAVVLALAIVCFAFGGCRSAPVPARRILLVTVDTLRADHLGYAGHDVETPNLDALGRAGATFTHAISAVPLTLPSHSTIFTGLYPQEHGARNNGTFHLGDEVETLAERMREAGYRTGAFVGAFVLDSRFGLAQGFDVYDDELPEENSVSKNYYAERPAEEVVARALSWVREQREKKAEKIFVWVHVFDCHVPYDPPAPFSERYRDRPYDGEIAYTDSALEPLLREFEGEDAVTLVTADHGESLGEHGEATHGLFVYESTTHVPLLLRASNVPAGTAIATQVRTADITPTLLDLAGLSSKRPLDGTSLLPLVRREESNDRLAYSESLTPFFNFQWASLRALREGRYTVIDAPRKELYDVSADPSETKNLWSQSAPPRAEELLAELRGIESRDDLAKASTAPVDAETVRKLESLGYVTAAASTPVEGRELADPKDRVEVYERLQGILGRTDLSSEELKTEYRKILELEPENSWARIRLANALAEEKRYEEAIREFRVLTDAASMDARAYENLGVALLLLDRVDEALDVTEKAVGKSGWDPSLQILFGEALERAHRPKDALAAYDRAIELEPEDAENYWRRGAVLQKLGETEEAESAFRKSLERDPTLEPAVLALARLLSQTGRSEEAARRLGADSGSSLSPSRKAGLAEVLISEGRVDDARKLLEEAHREEPDNTRVLALLGPIYAERRELSEARQMLEKARALGERGPDVRRNLALVYQDLGDLPAAIRELSAASLDAPEDDGIWFSLGNVYLRARRFDEAEKALEKCVELSPEREQALFNLALLYDRKGERRKAADAFQRFLRTGATDERRRSLAKRRLAELSQGG